MIESSSDNSELKKIKKVFENISKYHITFSLHFQKKAKEVREISEDVVINFLSSPEKILTVIPQPDNRYKVWFRKSRRYSLVVIISLKKDKYINVVTSFITSKKCQESLRIIRKR